MSFKEIAPEVRHFVFEVPEVLSLEYEPGQFFSFVEEIGGKTLTRAYSIASAPRGNRFELCLNRVKEGIFSPHLFRLTPGGAIDCKGPYGSFVLRSPLSDALLVATGTGVAPFRAMLQAILQNEPKRRFTLLLGTRNEDSVLYREEFEELARKHSNFRFWPTLSQPGPGWSGRTGRLQAHLAEALGDRRDIDVYSCGLEAMVDDIRRRLKDMGFERARIIYEKYD